MNNEEILDKELEALGVTRKENFDFYRSAILHGMQLAREDAQLSEARKAKELAIEFTLWLNKNRWWNFDYSFNKWCYTFEHGTSIRRAEYEKSYMKTSDELFDLFYQTKESNKE